MSDIPPTRRPSSLADGLYGARRSRRLLIDTLKALDDFGEAVTVIGAHAVHVWASLAWGPIDMQATRDADIVLNPTFVTDDPKLLDMMETIQVGPALPERPGVYGYLTEDSLPLAERTTIDLIVPDAYAGPGRRAARITGQERAASRAVGLELAIWDRQLSTLTTFDEPRDQVDAYVAGPAALLVAKAHKVHERLAQIDSRPDRLRPKDSGDVGLLMMVSDPSEVARVMFDAIRTHPETGPVIRQAVHWLTDMYANPDALPHIHALAALTDRFDRADVNHSIEAWLTTFTTTRDRLGFVIEGGQA